MSKLFQRAVHAELFQRAMRACWRKSRRFRSAMIRVRVERGTK